MPDDLRYQRLENLLDLALRLQGSVPGVSIDDVMEVYAVSRRTANRMLGAVRRVLGGDRFETNRDGRGRKRWRLARPIASGLDRPAEADLTALGAAASLADDSGQGILARELDGIARKLRVTSPPSWAPPPDSAGVAELEAEGLAHRTGPRGLVDPAILGPLRQAILDQRKVRVLVHGMPPAWHTLGPLGFVLEEGNHLVAWNGRRREVGLIPLGDVQEVLLTDDCFAPPAGFDLEAFSRESFGLPPCSAGGGGGAGSGREAFDVALRFKPNVAARAAAISFHPGQRSEMLEDGSLLVRFRASGLREMACHLFSWGSALEIIEPGDLRTELTRLAIEALRTHGREIDLDVGIERPDISTDVRDSRRSAAGIAASA